MIHQATPRRRRCRRSETTLHDQRDRWLISYADLVTLLFALFVVLYAAADHDRARAVASAIALEFGEAQVAPDGQSGRGVLPGSDSLVNARAAIERAFAANGVLRERARIATTERGLVVSLAEAGFFAPGEAALREDALALIDALADSLRETSAPLRIEGHTDSTPISTARFPSNWELSTARATAVFARLIARGLPSAQLSIAGYADEKPIADNATPEGRALNRRVDIVILQGGK
jgi:chemotaxis protein MotB